METIGYNILEGCYFFNYSGNDISLLGQKMSIFVDGGDVIDSIDVIRSIAPELAEIVERRYLILQTLSNNQPIGRRALATELGLSERIIRNEVNLLKSQGLLNIGIMGMNVTDEGKNLLHELNHIYKGFKGILDMQKDLEKALGLKQAIIVPGDSSDNSGVLREMGKVTAATIKSLIQAKDIIGITGGSTMASVAEEMTQSNERSDVLVIPARGGLGEEIETQSNAIAAKIGKKLGGAYRLLNVPDTLEAEALDIIVKNDEIKSSINLINRINLLVFGIGRADNMAHRRNLPKDRIETILSQGSVAEAFGHYFDIKGNEIWEYKTIGLSIDKFKEISNVIGVAGGAEKAEAIVAITSLRKDIIIVTDESAARKILELV